jgi:hypothetical protein
MDVRKDHAKAYGLNEPLQCLPLAADNAGAVPSETNHERRLWIHRQFQSRFRGFWFQLLIAVIAFPILSSASASAAGLPCDLLKATSPATPCVAAYSTVRRLNSSYTGALYQVTDLATNATKDIPQLSDGYANAATQDSFCGSDVCVISKIYDQSGYKNDVTRAPAGGAVHSADNLAYANALRVQAGGHKVYGVYISKATGYRNDNAIQTAVGQQPESLYMVASTNHVNGVNSCCFDFGNAETDNNDDNYGAMDALNLHCYGATLSAPCTELYGGLDLENGTYGMLAMPTDLGFATMISSNQGGGSSSTMHYQLWGGNAQLGSLSSPGVETLPNGEMNLQGAIVLGVGGDNSNAGIGSFYEGVMTKGALTSSTAAALQTEIISVGYSGFLPYHDSFAAGSAANWTTYGGSWSVSGESYANTSNDSNGDKAVIGVPTWQNYTLQGDVELTSGTGTAGLLLRVTDPDIGTNSLNGYYAGVENGNLIFGRFSNNWTQLASKAIPAGVNLNTWYHLTAQASGCSFVATAQPVGSVTVTSVTVTDAGCTNTAGNVGVRSYEAAAAWRDIQIVRGAGTNTPYYAPFAAGSSGWTTYGGSWSTSNETYSNTNSTDASDLAISNTTCQNCIVTGDVKVTSSSGAAGFLLRASNPATGTNAVNAYFFAVSAAGHITVQEEKNGAATVDLTTIPLFSDSNNVWFHLTAQVSTLSTGGCQIRVTAQRVTAARIENETTVADPTCTFTSGTVGLQSSQASANWRYVSVFNF